jgi:hypothetical protein
MKQHPLSAAFPAMPESELAGLTVDIEQFGQRESGVVLDGMVLDGWHRFQACERLGISFNYVEFDDEFAGTDPVAFVMSRNAYRRHLSASQRAAAIVACTTWRSAGKAAPGAGLKEPEANPAPSAGLTNAEMAKVANVGERTIRQAKAAERAGLGGAVRDGTISAKQAATVAAMPDEQRAAVVKSGAAQMQEVIAAAKKQVQGAAPKPAAPSPLELVTAERDELREQLSDVATAARELEAEVEAYRASERGEGEKQLVEANKRIAKLEGEVRRLESIRDDWMNKHAEALKQIKRLQREVERGHA